MGHTKHQILLWMPSSLARVLSGYTAHKEMYFFWLALKETMAVLNENINEDEFESFTQKQA